MLASLFLNYLNKTYGNNPAVNRDNIEEEALDSKSVEMTRASKDSENN